MSANDQMEIKQTARFSWACFDSLGEFGSIIKKGDKYGFNHYFNAWEECSELTWDDLESAKTWVRNRFANYVYLKEI